MSIAIEDLKRWLNTLPKCGTVVIDEGGLTIVCLEEKDAYIEVGGDPDVGQGAD